MKKILIILVFSFLTADQSQAKEYTSQVTDVVVFPNKAFVTRSVKLNVKRGTGVIEINDLTPSADRSSIKVKVPSSMKGFEVLAVKSDIKTLTNTNNPELEKLKDQRAELNKDIQVLRGKIDSIRKSNNNLSELSNHFQDSFSANLHSGKFKNKDFKDLVGFIKSKNGTNLNFWEKNFKALLALYEKRDYINNKISKTSGSRSVLELKVDYSNEVSKSGFIQVQYLVSGAGWSPAYDLRLKSSGRNASITQEAFIWQMTGEDWKNVNVSLSTETNPERSDPPSIYPKNLSYREVKKVKTNVLSKNEVQKTLLGSGDDANDKDQKSSLVMRFKPKGKFTILDNHPKVRVPINSKTQKYEEEILAIAGKFFRAFKSASMKNPFSTRMNSGPLFIFRDGKFIQQTPLRSVGPGESFTVNTGFLNNIQVSHNYQYDKEKEGLIDKTKRIARKSITKLKSFNSKPVILKLYDQIPISQIDEVKVKSEKSTDGLKKDSKKETWNYWIVTLKPDEKKTYEMNLALEIPEDMNFQWPR
jgi:uncharacterized protein (TIGR02231 family)